MYDLYVFDLDGTLIESYKTIGNLFNKVLDDNNLEVLDLELYKYLLGDGAKVLVEKGLKRSLEIKGEYVSEEEFNRILEKIYPEYMDLYNNFDDNITKPYDCIKSTLNILKGWNKKIAICTNKPQPATDIIVDKIFGKDYFDMVVGMTDERVRKPDKSMLVSIVENLDIDKSRVAYFGDTSVDIRTGKNAEVVTVGVTWGFREKEELMEFGADRIINRPMDILRV